MIKKKSIFRNLFSNHTITPKRLAYFGGCVYISLKTANRTGQYSAILLELREMLENLEAEICNVSVNLIEQKFSTETVDAFIERFIEFMKDNEPFIASALGGRKAPGYIGFYPRGAMRYEKINKTKMRDLTGLIHGLAEKYSEKLGAELAGKLQAFAGDYDMLRNGQQGKMAKVSLNRIKRNKYFKAAQWVLTAVVHQVACINRSNIAASESIFPFEKLYPQTRSRKVRAEGELAVHEMKELLNRERGKSAVVTIRNTGVNADVAVWVTDTVSDTIPAGVIIVKALSSRKLTAAMLNGFTGTRLMIANLSRVNKAFYEVEISGLKKDKKDNKKNTATPAEPAAAEAVEEIKADVA